MRPSLQQGTAASSVNRHLSAEPTYIRLTLGLLFELHIIVAALASDKSQRLRCERELALPLLLAVCALTAKALSWCKSARKRILFECAVSEKQDQANKSSSYGFTFFLSEIALTYPTTKDLAPALFGLSFHTGW